MVHAGLRCVVCTAVRVRVGGKHMMADYHIKNVLQVARSMDFYRPVLSWLSLRGVVALGIIFSLGETVPKV